MKVISTPQGSGTHMLAPTEGDPERLVEAWRLAYRIARRATRGEPSYFDDVYQECMLRAWERIEQGHPKGIVNYAMKQAAADLMTGGRMTGSKMGGGFTDTSRKAVSIYRPDSEDGKVEYVIEPQVASHEDRIALEDAVERALGGLTEVQREIVRLHFWEGLTYKEVAERRGSSHQTVSSLMDRIKRKLRDSLADVGAA